MGSSTDNATPPKLSTPHPHTDEVTRDHSLIGAATEPFAEMTPASLVPPIGPSRSKASTITAYQTPTLSFARPVTKTQRGEVLLIMHQYAHSPTSKTIHVYAQMEAYKADVNDKSTKVPGGLQHIKTLEGFVIPLNIRAALPYTAIRPYTDAE
jgi:hypothetical protein